ncbi:MAG: sulfite exporter TauE/SafE family protein [Cellvibrionaceae bacterium]|nr:sulfite exporter TauE/SafE family protein [Cellvibrionaceae bacterium]MCV6628214.1 sulfite exporter TauE/SafE family protein [Cellvibrionaceae bacterium]
MEAITYILAGAAVGLAVGVTGVGGGSLMTPLLILFGIPYNVAIGTDLLFAAFTKAGGVRTHHKLGNINWSLVKLLAMGSIPASLLTALLLRTLFQGATDYQDLLTHSLGLMLIVTSAVILFKKRLQQASQSNQGIMGALHRHGRSVTLISGMVLGVLVTLSSVGAGAFCAALLLVLYPQLKASQVVGTDIAHAVPLTLIAGLGHLFFLGNVDFLLLGALLLGSLPAIHIGSQLSSKVPNHVLQPTLASLLMLLGFKFAFL